MDTVLQVISEEPVPPSRLQPRVAPDLETVCLKCLNKEPYLRYASAAALAEDLDRFLRDEPIQARPVNVLRKGLKWARRRPTVAALVTVSVAAFVVVVVSVFGILYSAHLRSERDLELTARAAADEALAARNAQAEVEKALAESRRREALSYLTYGRACAAAARVANAASAQDAEWARLEFCKFCEGLSLTGDEVVKPALIRFDQALRQWKYGDPTDVLQEESLNLAHACRTYWREVVGRDFPQMGDMIRTGLYTRACAAADQMARARRPEDVKHARQEFLELYWGELAIVESKPVEGAMKRFRDALLRWQKNEPPAELRRLADELRTACAIPLGGRRT